MSLPFLSICAKNENDKVVTSASLIAVLSLTGVALHILDLVKVLFFFSN